METWSHGKRRDRQPSRTPVREPGATRRVEMQLPVKTPDRSSLRGETLQSALLLGGALGLMITLALVMFFVSTRVAG